MLTLLAQGNSNRARAAEMAISEPTVKKHVQRIVAKLDVNDRVQAAVVAVREGRVAP